MGLLTCDCLNVKIHVGSDVVEELRDKPGQDSFWGTAGLVKCGVGGVSVAQPLLMKKRVSGRYQIHTCGNCRWDTHATPTNFDSATSGKLHISKSLVKGSHDTQREGYSPIFQLVVNKEETKPHESGIPMIPEAMNIMNELNVQFENKMRAERAAMEARIRSYVEQQEKEMQMYEKRGQDEKRALFRTVCHMYQDAVSDALSEAMRSRAMTEPSPTPPAGISGSTQSLKMDTAGSVDRLNLPTAEIIVGSQADHQPRSLTNPDVEMRLRYPVKPPLGKFSPSSVPTSKSRSFTTASAASSLFVMEGFEDERDVSSDSEEEEAEDAPSSAFPIPAASFQGRAMVGRADGRIRERDPGLAMLATSLPIAIPARMHSWKADPVDDQESPPQKQFMDDRQMAASMRELSQSIVNDSTAMFGELPRRRPSVAY
eukprot:Colp12_sorted_trinity150504_noHs@10893